MNRIAAQENGRRNRMPNRNNRPPMQMTAEMTRQWNEIQTRLKQKYPQKFAEIEKLASANLAEAMQKMIALAREAEIALPMSQRSRDRRGEGFGRPREGFGGPEGGMRGERFGGRRRPYSGMGMTGGHQRIEAEAKIKAQFPKEFAEIEKTRNQAEEQLQALARKAGVKLPPAQDAVMRKMAAIREKYKNEFEEIRKLRETDPQTARERTMEIFKREGVDFMPMDARRSNDLKGPAPARRGNPMRKIAEIRKAYPDEMKKIDGLQRENPQQYRMELRKLAERYDREHSGK